MPRKIRSVIQNDLFVIYASTLGGACTLIGTPTNIYANTALEEAGLSLFGMFDFAWVGIPIFILGGIYMIVMNAGVRLMRKQCQVIQR